MSNDRSADKELEELFESSGAQHATTRRKRVQNFVDLRLRAPLRIMIHDWRALLGSLIILGFLLMGTVGRMVVERPTSGQAPSLAPPFQNMDYILGADLYGQDLAAQIVYATPDMFKMVFAGGVLAVSLAAITGVVSGFSRGSMIDSAIMTLVDIVIAIPGLPLMIVLAAVFQPQNPYLVGILLGLDNWPGLARAIRSQVLSIREEAYVEASKIMGLSRTTIYWRDILKQLMPYTLINSAIAARRIIFEAVGLYFIGVLSVQSFNWGVIMNLAYKANALYQPSKFHWLFFPMLAIILFSFGLVLLSQGMDSVFNVRLRARYSQTITEEGTQDQ